MGRNDYTLDDDVISRRTRKYQLIVETFCTVHYNTFIFVESTMFSKTPLQRLQFDFKPMAQL